MGKRREETSAEQKPAEGDGARRRSKNEEPVKTRRMAPVLLKPGGRSSNSSEGELGLKMLLANKLGTG